MAKLTKCLTKAKIDRHTRKKLSAIAEGYVADGKSEAEAQRMAADDILTELIEERDDIIRQVQKAGGVLPGEESRLSEDEQAEVDAAAEKRRQDWHKVRIENEMERMAAAGRPESPSEYADAKRREFLASIINIGGINKSEATDITGESLRRAMQLRPVLFKTNGRTLDDIATAMRDAGYVTDDSVDGGIAQMREMIRDALEKRPVLTQAQQERYAELLADEKMESMAAQADAEEGLDATALDVLDTALVERAMEMDPDGGERAAVQFENDEAGLLAWARSVVDGQEAGTEAAVESRAEADQGRPPVQGDEGAGPPAAPAAERGDAGAGPEAVAEPPALDLTAQTEASRQAEERATRDADALEAEQADRAQARLEADRAREGFSLTGSDRDADVAVSRGQKPLLRAGELPGKAAAGAKVIRKALDERFGADGIGRLLENDILRIVDAGSLPENLRDAIDESTTGLYDQDTQTAYILADRATPETVDRILIHEVGEHHGLPHMLGQTRFTDLLQDVRRMMVESKDETFKAAVEHVRKNYSLDEASNGFAREVIARYAENPGAASWWDRLVSEVRQFMFRHGFTKELSEKDVALLVQKSLRKTLRGEVKKYGKDGTEASADGGALARRGDYPEEREALKNLPDETKPQALVRVLADQMNRWHYAVEYLEKKYGIKLTGAENVVEKEKLFYGKAQTDYNQVERDYIKPIQRIALANKLSLELVDKYLRALHAPERNAAIAKINPDKPADGAGMLDADTPATTANAKAFIAGLTAAQREPLQRIGELTVALNRWRLDQQREMGLISDSEHKVLTTKYKHYVPLKNIEEEDAGSVGAVGYAVRGKEWRRAFGRASLSDSPLLVSIQDTTRSILRSRRGEVGQAVLKLAQNQNARELMEVLDPESMPADFVEKKIHKVPVLDANGKQTGTKEEVYYGIKASYPNARNVFPVKVNGKYQYVLIKDDLLATQIKKMGEAELGRLMEAANSATSLLGRMFTQYNPAFVLINHFRDLMAVSINSRAVSGMNVGRVMKGTYDAMPVIASHLFGQGKHPRNAEYQEFLKAGATIGGLGLRTLKQMGSDIKERGMRLKDADNPPVARMAWGKWKDTLDMISNVNEIVENATRFSVYTESKRAFMDPNGAHKLSKQDAIQRAAVLAREISVDFNKRGEWSRNLNALYVFFNAAVQGLRSFIKFGRHTRVQQALFALMAGGAVARMMAQVMGGWDDELEEENALKFEQSSDMSAPMVFGDKVLKVPIPYLFNVPWAIGYRAMDAMLTGRVGHNIGHMLMATMTSTSPLGEPKKAATPVGFLMKTFSPSLLTPIADIADNTNRYGTMLARNVLWDQSAPPRAYQHWAGASSTGKAVAHALNIASGGDDYKPGWFNVSPDWLDYLSMYYTGGVGRTISQIIKTVDKGADPLRDVSAADVPIASRIVSDLRPDFYVPMKYRELTSELEYANDYRKAGKMDKITPAQRAALPAYLAGKKQLKTLYEQLRMARDGGNQERELQLEERIVQAKMRVVQRYNAGDGDFMTLFNAANRKDVAKALRDADSPALAGLVEDGGG